MLTSQAGAIRPCYTKTTQSEKKGMVLRENWRTEKRRMNAE
jgi:hypothetical protein